MWLYKAKVNKKGQYPLYIRISYSGTRKTIASGYYIDPSKWDSNKSRLKGNLDDAKGINNYIQQTQSKLISLYNDMLVEGDINLNKLVDRFYGRDITPLSLMELVKHHNEDFHKRIGIDYTFSTYEKYDILRKKLELFIPHKYGKPDIRLHDGDSGDTDHLIPEQIDHFFRMKKTR